MVYIALGSLLLFTQLGSHVIAVQRSLIGGLLLGYGLLRGFLWYRKTKSATSAA